MMAVMSYNKVTFEENHYFSVYSQHQISVPMPIICTTFNINFGL